MTASAGWLGKIGAGATNPALVGIVAGGLVVGSIGGLTLGGRAAVLEAPPEPLPLFACPDGQRGIGSVEPGEEVLVTARSGDGNWLEIHYPDGAQDRAWGERAAFTLDADPGSLPIAGCAAQSEPPLRPGSSLTIAAAFSPSPAPTHRPTPTPAPDTGCARESSLRSLEGLVKATLVITNNSNLPVQAFWLDYTGKRVLYGQVPPSTSFEQPTWLTHPWVIANAQGACARLVVIGSDRQTITLNPGDVPA
jgi:hypothetical protein